MLSTVKDRDAGQRTNSKCEQLKSVGKSNLHGWTGLSTRPITMKKSSRPMFLVIEDLT